MVLGVRDSDRSPVGIEPDKRELVEQLVVTAATENCVPIDRTRSELGVSPRSRRTANTVHDRRDPAIAPRVASDQRRPLSATRRQPPASDSGRAVGAHVERPVFGSSLEDLHDLRLDRYFRDRFLDWSARRDAWQRPRASCHEVITPDGIITLGTGAAEPAGIVVRYPATTGTHTRS